MPAKPGPIGGAALGRREEEAVVQKQTVAKERVSLEKDVETERATIADELRKERVGVDVDENVGR